MTVKVDGIYPAVQFHFSTSEKINVNQQQRIKKQVGELMIGVVKIEYTPRRVIVTATAPEYHEQIATRIQQIIERATMWA